MISKQKQNKSIALTFMFGKMVFSLSVWESWGKHIWSDFCGMTTHVSVSLNDRDSSSLRAQLLGTVMIVIASHSWGTDVQCHSLRLDNLWLIREETLGIWSLFLYFTLIVGCYFWQQRRQFILTSLFLSRPVPLPDLFTFSFLHLQPAQIC